MFSFGDQYNVLEMFFHSLVPEPVFEFTMYTVRENDRTVPLCIDVGFQVSESVAYTITAMQIDPPQAEGTFSVRSFQNQ